MHPRPRHSGPGPEGNRIRLRETLLPITYIGWLWLSLYRSGGFDPVFQPVGENPHGAGAPVGHRALPTKLGQNGADLLPGGADAAGHLFVGRILLAQDAAVGLRRPVLG